MMYFSPDSFFLRMRRTSDDTGARSWIIEATENMAIFGWANSKRGKTNTWPPPKKITHTPYWVKKMQELKAQGGVECWLLFWMVFRSQPQEICWLCKHFCFANISTVLTKQWQRARNKRRPGHSGVHQGLLHVLGFPRIHFITKNVQTWSQNWCLQVGQRWFQRKVKCVWAMRFLACCSRQQYLNGIKDIHGVFISKNRTMTIQQSKIANQPLYYYAIIQQSL